MARFDYTASVALHHVQLEDTEIKLLLVAIRQVQNTFAIADSQSAAAGEPLAEDYEGVREAYGRLLRKLAALVAKSDPGAPYLVK